jgi:hypothetical protein
MIWLPLSRSLLNVWKNSVCVCSCPAKNWMSSISRTSML